jgi:hypothetical protein
LLAVFRNTGGQGCVLELQATEAKRYLHQL